MRARSIAFATCANYRELAPSDRLLADELTARGWKVEPVVWSETAPEAIRTETVVIRSVWDYHLNVMRFVAWVEEVANRAVVWNPPELVRWNSNKRYLEEIRRAGFGIPKTVILNSVPGSLGAIMATSGMERAVLKPLVSASAFRTNLVNLDTAKRFQSEFEAMVGERAMLLQEYVPEITESGEWSLMFLGGRYSHSVRKVPKLGDFRVQAEHGGSHIHEEAPSAIRKAASGVMERFARETLYARVDMVERGEEALLMELELIDPELFIEPGSPAIGRFAEALQFGSGG
jgi:glutathione synthase/RimK-type ligase-like ATP-grasp enzyme